MWRCCFLLIHSSQILWTHSSDCKLLVQTGTVRTSSVLMLMMTSFAAQALMLALIGGHSKMFRRPVSITHTYPVLGSISILCTYWNALQSSGEIQKNILEDISPFCGTTDTHCFGLLVMSGLVSVACVPRRLRATLWCIFNSFVFSNRILKFISGAASADLLAANMAAESLWPPRGQQRNYE